MKKIKEQYLIPDQGIVLFSARSVIAVSGISLGGNTEGEGDSTTESYTEENGTW